MDLPARLERLAQWYAEAFQSLDDVERQIHEVLLSLGLAPQADQAVSPGPSPTHA